MDNSIYFLWQYVKKKYEKGQGMKEDSSLKDKVKVSKRSEKSATSSNTPRVTKDIIKEGFDELHFPVSFPM